MSPPSPCLTPLTVDKVAVGDAELDELVAYLSRSGEHVHDGVDVRDAMTLEECVVLLVVGDAAILARFTVVVP